MIMDLPTVGQTDSRSGARAMDETDMKKNTQKNPHSQSVYSSTGDEDNKINNTIRNL